MDIATFGGYAGLIAVGVQTIQGIIMTMNHYRIRSQCCGLKLETSLDIEKTTPPSSAQVSAEKLAPIRVPDQT